MGLLTSGRREQQPINQKEEHRMAFGKQIGAFSLKQTSSTLTPGSGGTQVHTINLQGQVSGEAGEGIAVGTMTVEYEPNMKSGTWSYCGMTALNQGGGNTVSSQGTWEETGHLKFRHHGTAKFSDGRTCGVEFENDVTSGSQTLSGKLYAWS
jgi:hypothetical protein